MKSRIAALALAAAVSLGLAGCNLAAPQDTTIQYDPSDGVSAEVGQIGVRNALVVTADGSLGSLVMTVTNRSASDIDLTVQFKDANGERVNLTVPTAPGVTPFGFANHGQIVLADLGATPGGLIDIFFQYGSEQGQQVQVPVLAPCLAEYAGLLPQYSSLQPETSTTEAPTTDEGTEGEAVSIDVEVDALADALAELDAAHAELAAAICEIPEPADRGGHH